MCTGAIKLFLLVSVRRLPMPPELSLTNINRPRIEKLFYNHDDKYSTSNTVVDCRPCS